MMARKRAMEQKERMMICDEKLVVSGWKSQIVNSLASTCAEPHLETCRKVTGRGKGSEWKG